MLNQEEYQKELTKLRELFACAAPEIQKLIEGLIDDAAFLKASNQELKKSLVETGMVKIHPVHREIQRPIETAKQYLKNLNSYAVVIKTLNSILLRGTEGEDDAFDDWLKDQRKE